MKCLIVMLLFLATVVGCGTAAPPLLEVRGKVTYEGQPIDDLTVHFLPESGRPSWGVTDAEGNFVLEFSSGNPGVVKGNHRVFLTFDPSDTQVKMDMEMGNYRPPAVIEEILGKYGDPETTPLSFSIQESQSIDLELGS